MRVLVLGGSGFIGSALVRKLVEDANLVVGNIDKITYACHPNALTVVSSKNYKFWQVDITDKKSLRIIFSKFNPDIIINLAAETHVDNSIRAPKDFVTTNFLGVAQILEATREYWATLDDRVAEKFRLIHISTDEVYGDYSHFHNQASETSKYNPSSPYAATKASADHLIRAWHRTYGLPVVIIIPTNNYGPFQHSEKLIPKTILNALNGWKIPVYGDGKATRDWIYVEDHVEAILKIMYLGQSGETYNISSNTKTQNITMVTKICILLDELYCDELKIVESFCDLISFVPDRPGHDLSYNIDSTKLRSELFWKPRETLESGLRKTITWYLKNQR